MKKIALLIISLIYLPYSYAGEDNGSIGILAPIIGAFQAGDYEVRRARQESEILQTEYQNYMMEEQLIQYANMRAAETYLAPFWTYYYQARSKGINPIIFIDTIINQISHDQTFKNMDVERQGVIFRQLIVRIKQLAYKLQTEGDSKSANIILKNTDTYIK